MRMKNILRLSCRLVSGLTCALAVALGVNATAATPATSATNPAAQAAVNLNGIGGTFPKALYAKWFKDYQEKTGVTVNYQALGSGDGIRAIQDQTADFGASDAALSDKQLSMARGGEILHIPTAFGGIVLSYNLPGIKETLKLTPEVIAAIYLGEIGYWDDERLLADNPALRGRHFPVVVVHRKDGSGTTAGFTHYLSAVSPAWASRAGSGTSIYWPRGAAAVGNDGVARTIGDNPYSIGYIEQGFAADKKMPYAMVKNRSGRFVEATPESISMAAASAIVGSGLDLRLDAINASGAEAYPITTGTYVLIYRNQTDPVKGRAIVQLLKWAVHDGQKSNRALFFAPVPTSLTSRIDAALSAVTINGQPADR